MSKHITNEQWIEAISSSLSYAEALRKLGLRDSGGNYTTLHARIKELGIDTSHMTGQVWNQGDRFRPFHKEIKSDDIFCKGKYRSTGVIKRRLFKDGIKENRCENCGITCWVGEPIQMELHHIDGDRSNNLVENLQILCPNCHSLTDTFRGKNKKNMQK